MVKISRIVNQNPWWEYTNFSNKDPDLRKLEEKDITYKRKGISLDQKNLYSLWGPRQIGKTTWVKTTIASLIQSQKIDPRAIMYISCDRLSSRKELKGFLDWFEETTREFEKVFIFLDEITYLEKWVSTIKAFTESSMFTKTSLMITGSSPMELKKGGERLPGRGGEENEYLLKPLLFREFLLQATKVLTSRFPKRIPGDIHRMEKLLQKNFVQPGSTLEDVAKKANMLIPHKNSLDSLFEIYLALGGFPMPLESYLKNKGEKIENWVYQTFVRFVLGDFTKLGKTETVTRQVLDGIISKLGTRYSYITLSKGLDVSHITTIDYLEGLETSFILHTLYAYDFNKKSPKYKANKKIYFLDPFIFYSVYAWLEGTDGYSLTKDFLKKEENKSSLVENIIASHLIKTKETPYTKEPITFLWYYHNRKEIDFVYKKSDNTYLGIESKYKAETITKDIQKISEIKENIIVSKDDFEIKKDVIIVPVSIFLAMLQGSKKNL